MLAKIGRQLKWKKNIKQKEKEFTPVEQSFRRWCSQQWNPPLQQSQTRTQKCRFRSHAPPGGGRFGWRCCSTTARWRRGWFRRMWWNSLSWARRVAGGRRPAPPGSRSGTCCRGARRLWLPARYGNRRCRLAPPRVLWSPWLATLLCELNVAEKRDDI